MPMNMTRLTLRCIPAGAYITELLLIFMGGYFCGKYVEAKERSYEENDAL